MTTTRVPKHSFFLGLVAALFSVQAFSLPIPVQQVATEKHDYYLTSGVFVGGYSQPALSVLRVRDSQRDGDGERFVIDMGLGDGRTKSLRPGFFHIALQTDPRRILADLENIKVSKLTDAELKKTLTHSKFFSEGRVFDDPETGHLTLELELKKSAKVEVFELSKPGHPGRIVMDLKAL